MIAPAVGFAGAKSREERTMAMGTVKVWSPARGSGWIMPDAGGNRLYVHKSGIEVREEGRAPRLEPGQRVEYQIGPRPKGPGAINVRPTAVAAPAAAAAAAPADPPSADATVEDETGA